MLKITVFPLKITISRGSHGIPIFRSTQQSWHMAYMAVGHNRLQLGSTKVLVKPQNWQKFSVEIGDALGV
jgi:hypothetical protein